jgi:mono/diheme cytochrome c family protein
MTRNWFGLAALLLALGVAAVLVFRGADDATRASMQSATAQPVVDIVARGEYLARAGNCMHCHTERGGAPYAGGRALETPFGSVYTSNLTPDADTGIGHWSADDFWQALHFGRSKDGHWLLPAFPYGNFTRVNRADSDALYAWLRTVPAVAQANRAHALAWPFSSQWALGIWRGLFFRAQVFKSDTSQSEQWNRGAYLVQGLGHCSACHSARNVMGASSDAMALAGGMIAGQDWYAPALASRSHAGGVPPWTTQAMVQMLQTGTSNRGAAMGPMAEVVLHSTQHLSPADLAAMALYLEHLPPVSDTRASASSRPLSERDAPGPGAKLYQDHCAQCHAEDGQGVPHAYPALAGSGAVNMASPMNLVQIVLNGGFAPATSGNPRPFGMPPFALSLSDHDIAAVLSYVRSAWGNRAGEVTPQDVDRLRGHAH